MYLLNSILLPHNSQQFHGLADIFLTDRSNTTVTTSCRVPLLTGQRGKQILLFFLLQRLLFY
jgi:hypothetical protein